MKEKQRIIIVVLVFITIGVTIFSVKERLYNKKLKALTSIKPEQVITLNIYAKASIPSGSPVKFRAPDLIIDDFLKALTDVHSYSPSRDTIASDEHIWFLEVFTKHIEVSISFDIPSGKGDIVVGTFGKFGTFATPYGSFQSQQLFQWYQKYSHRWLEPLENTP